MVEVTVLDSLIVCRTCFQAKPRSEFYASRRFHCKACESKRAMKVNESNPNRRINQRNHRDKVRAANDGKMDAKTVSMRKGTNLADQQIIKNHRAEFESLVAAAKRHVVLDDSLTGSRRSTALYNAARRIALTSLRQKYRNEHRSLRSAYVEQIRAGATIVVTDRRDMNDQLLVIRKYLKDNVRPLIRQAIPREEFIGTLNDLLDRKGALYRDLLAEIQGPEVVDPLDLD